MQLLWLVDQLDDRALAALVLEHHAADCERGRGASRPRMWAVSYKAVYKAGGGKKALTWGAKGEIKCGLPSLRWGARSDARG